MNKYILFSSVMILSFSTCFIQNTKAQEIKNKNEYKEALVSYDDFKNLVSEVENHRKQKLINLDKFLEMSKEKDVIILDTRSTSRYERKHLKGSKHLSFTDFTQGNLYKVIPNLNTKILIYCNNNFAGDPVDFETKMSVPQIFTNQILSQRKPVMLALNIPTYINLYGYGYKNIYELNELVNINDKRIEFEGTEIK